MATAAVTTGGVLARLSSYVEWPAIIAGAITAAAVSFVLLTFGSAIGLTAASPWPNSGLPGWLIGVIAALWVLIVQAGSYALGGYIAGRLRAPAAEANLDERQFRDGAHGFLVWALGIVITALVVGWTAGAVVKGGAEAAATVASGAAQGAASASNAFVPDPLSYSVDRLYRPANAAPAGGAAPAAGTPPRATTGPSGADRIEARRILVSALASNSLPADDKAYLAARVTAVGGVPPADAEKRVDEVFAAVQQAKAQATEAADKARRAAAIAAFLAATAALIAAAAGAAGAGLGGRHRDENGALRMFGRPRFW